MALSATPPPLSASTQLRLRAQSTSTSSAGLSNVPSAPPPSWIARVATQVDSFFHTLGLLLSTHQIPSLLLCSLLICSLLAPTLLHYFNPASDPGFSITPKGRPQLPWNAEGLTRQGLIKSEDQVCWDRLNTYYAHRELLARVVHVEQVLVSSAGAGGWRGGGALSKPTLHRALLVQSELERRLLAGEVEGLSCVRDGAGCAIGSPLGWWETEATLMGDQDVHATLSLPAPLSVGDDGASKAIGLPLTSSNTLVGIGRDRHGTVKGAHRLAITFYLVSDLSPTSSLRNASSPAPASHAKVQATWRRAVREVVDGQRWAGTREKHDKLGKVTEGRGEGRRVVLKYLPNLRAAPHPRALEDLFYVLGYIAVAFYVRSSIRSLGPHVVHSQTGLLLTGVVQLSLSGIMTLSVLSVFGWDVALVPWNLMIFLVLVCGVDNMLVLTNAVSRTDIRLPVPERVARGLSAVGLSTTFTLLLELSFAFTLLALVEVQVIRQIVTFSAVVLVVDHFLDMTFFTTILSIDIQRLELADLLTRNLGHRHMPSTPSEVDDSEFLPSSLEPKSRITQVRSLLAAAKTGLRDRAARTATFGIVFFIDASLYVFYGPDHFLPAFCSETGLLASNRPLLSPSLSAEISRSLQRGQRGASPITYPADKIRPGAAAAFWRIINPGDASSAVHLHVEPVTAIQFFDDGLLAPESILSSNAIVETSWWARAGMIILPIAATMAVLWLLLLFLLKDADLLESERERGIKERKERRQAREGAGVEAVRLNGSWKGDVELVASGREAVVSWAGLDDQVILWRRRKSSSDFTATSRLDPTLFDPPTPLEIPLAADPPSLTLLAIDPSSRFAAAATMTGRVLVWSLERKLLIDFGSSAEKDPTFLQRGAPVALFSSTTGATASKDSAPPGSRTSEVAVAFCSIHPNGIVVLWDCDACTSKVVYSPEDSPSSAIDHTLATLAAKPKLHVLHLSPQSLPRPTPVYARSYTIGRLSLIEPSGDPLAPGWSTFFDEQVSTAGDTLTALACGEVEMVGEGESRTLKRRVLLVGTLSGVVSLHLLPNVSPPPASDTPLPSAGSRLCTVTELDGPVRQIRLAPSPRRAASTTSEFSDRCPTCAQVLNDGFVVVSASKTSLQVHRFSIGSEGLGVSVGQGCTCGPRIGNLATPKKVRRASHGRVVNGGGLSGEEGVNERRMRRENDGSEAQSPPQTPTTINPASPSTPTVRIQRPVPDTDDNAISVPLFSTVGSALDTSPSSSPPPAPSGLERLQVHDVLATYNDERGGWELAGEKIVGVRRQRASGEAASARGSSRWEVWSAGLAIGSTVGVSELDRLLRVAGTVEQPDLIAGSASTPVDSLRRRNVKASPPLPSSTIPTIRFQGVDLPFSRARSVTSSLAGTSVAVGLGNQLLVFAPRPIGRAGLLALPSRVQK